MARRRPKREPCAAPLSSPYALRAHPNGTHEVVPRRNSTPFDATPLDALALRGADLPCPHTPRCDLWLLGESDEQPDHVCLATCATTRRRYATERLAHLADTGDAQRAVFVAGWVPPPATPTELRRPAPDLSCVAPPTLAERRLDAFCEGLFHGFVAFRSGGPATVGGPWVGGAPPDAEGFPRDAPRETRVCVFGLLAGGVAGVDNTDGFPIAEHEWYWHSTATLFDGTLTDEAVGAARSVEAWFRKCLLGRQVGGRPPGPAPGWHTDLRDRQTFLAVVGAAVRALLAAGRATTQEQVCAAMAGPGRPAMDPATLRHYTNRVHGFAGHRALVAAVLAEGEPTDPPGR